MVIGSLMGNRVLPVGLHLFLIVVYMFSAKQRRIPQWN